MMPKASRRSEYHEPISSWSPQQERALRLFKRWWRDLDRQVFRLHGYAGTGKTELAVEIGQLVRKPHFCALTGKAAQVLAQRGAEPVSTIHKLIYSSSFDSQTNRFVHDLRGQEALADIELIIIDEASMLDDKLADDLCSFEIPIVVIGDPFQLPSPSEQWQDFFFGTKPDAMLTEVHRLAADNPLLDFAHKIRLGHWRIYPRDSIAGVLSIVKQLPEPEQYDVVLCGKNSTRRDLNSQIRRALRYDDHGITPQLDETLVCLRNDYSVSDIVLNGSTWRIVKRKDVMIGNVLGWELELVSEFDASRTQVKVPVACFSGGPVPWRGPWQLFDYGYALTVHKAQGSAWPNLAVVDESFCFTGLAARWLYTAVTRSSAQLTLVRNR